MLITNHTREKPKLPKKKLSFEEFLDWCDEDTLAEFVDGEIIMYSPASRTHQEIGVFLSSVLNIYVEEYDLGEIFYNPFVIRLPKLNRGREPDLLFVSKERLNLLKETYLNGPADLAVEIISKESKERDRYEKFNEYEKASVKEYWLIDPYLQEASFYQLKEDGSYHPVNPDSSGIYRSKVVQGFWLKVSWLWDIPPVLDALKELGLLP